MKSPLIIALAAATALSGMAPAFAQSQYRQVRDPYAEAQYQREMEAYYSQQRTYQDQRQAYDNRVDRWANDRVSYESRREQYLRDRRAYDARYGVGAYDRRYPEYYRDFARGYDARYSYGYGDRYGADSYGVNASTNVQACDSRNNATVGGLLGALAGAALGSNVAARNARTEGAVLGAVVGGAIGAQVGKSTARCDDAGYYYSYDQTQPYREAMADRRGRSGRYDYNYYTRQNCRLATAPTEWSGRTEYRYVRVCPDAQGRYRITG